MAVFQHKSDWLIGLLEQSRLIFIHDGLGTFVHKTDNGWMIRGRDDVVSLLQKRIFDDLSVALDVAKSLKHKFAIKKGDYIERT